MKSKTKLTLAIIALLTLSGCNRQMVDLNLKFSKVHIYETNQCYNINSWRDYEDGDQIQVDIDGYGKCLFHSNQVILIANKCPFCD